MDVYTHEKEQIENIKAWWRENRWYIIAGLVISAALVGGWRYWQEHRQQQAEAASIRYEQLQTQATAGNIESVQERVKELQNDYSGTPYAALGTLRLAALQTRSGDYQAAADSLRWAMQNTDDNELAKVAQLRLARVLLQRQDADAALGELASMKPGKFGALYEEVRGDALLAKGDRDAARLAYEAALAAMEPGLGDRELVERKLQNVRLPAEVLNAAFKTAKEPAPEAAVDEAASGDAAGETEQ